MTAQTDVERLPPGVRLVTVQVPVWTGDFAGTFDGGRGEITGNLGRPAAQICQRMILAQELIAEARKSPFLPRPEIRRIASVRLIFEAVGKAMAAEEGAPEPAPSDPRGGSVTDDDDAGPPNAPAIPETGEALDGEPPGDVPAPGGRSGARRARKKTGTP